VIYPVSEIFQSLQGEGGWQGTPMTFIRLAGCTVGKPYTAEARKTLGLSIYQERCMSWDGVAFTCDTDYRVKRRLTEDDIARTKEVAGALHVCITGGEPLMHDLLPLCHAIWDRGIAVHIETSGTIDFSYLLRDEDLRSTKIWVCVSPKQGCLEQALEDADEIKVLVGNNFDYEKFEDNFADYIQRGKVCISPINGEHTFDQDNMRRCYELCMANPRLRLSMQIHKLLQIR
jgi:7-carboxy-7-deazaguanine synthase